MPSPPHSSPDSAAPARRRRVVWLAAFGVWGFFGFMTSQFHLELLTYGVILGVGYAFDYYARFRERERRASQLESQLAQAQLQALKMQLQPHFLFNTLNGVAGLVRDNRNKEAVNMIAGLSDLPRHTLESAGRQEVTLREELDFLELYLGLQQMRFPDRLRVELRVEPETLDALVPNLILQPLVENAVRHGIAPRASSGTVGVTAEREDSLLWVTVYDDGPGLGPPSRHVSKEGGIGLSNTRARLEQLHGARHRFGVRSREGGGAPQPKPEQPQYLTRFLIKAAGRVSFLQAEEIDWIGAEDYCVKLRVGRKGHLLRETMNDLEARLDPSKFIRIHRSTIVNVERIKELQQLFNGDYAVVLRDGTELRLSRRRREQMQTLLRSGRL